MSFKNLFIAHDRSAEVEQWMKEEDAEQEARYQKVVDQMNALSPQREKWYQEFFDRITTSGFNVDNDQKQVIKPEDLPVKPDGLANNGNQVVWKYGQDGE